MTPTTSVTVRVRFEAAHRLPQLDGKCRSLHGHSWQAWVTIAASVDPDTGVAVDMGHVKSRLQAWVDEHLDHATLLGDNDPLVGAIGEADPYGQCKVFVFGGHEPRRTVEDNQSVADLRWPTVENVAALLHRVAVGLVPTGRVSRVEVRETENNAVTVTP